MMTAEPSHLGRIHAESRVGVNGQLVGRTTRSGNTSRRPTPFTVTSATLENLRRLATARECIARLQRAVALVTTILKGLGLTWSALPTEPH